MRTALLLGLFFLLAFGVAKAHAQPDASHRPRARDLGLAPGVLGTGPLNAITDVPQVKVGQVTVWEGERVRTGVTVILPHDVQTEIEARCRAVDGLLSGEKRPHLRFRLATAELEHLLIERIEKCHRADRLPTGI